MQFFTIFQLFFDYYHDDDDDDDDADDDGNWVLQEMQKGLYSLFAKKCKMVTFLDFKGAVNEENCRFFKKKTICC